MTPQNIVLYISLLDIYWQKPTNFICDVTVVLACMPLFYGLTTVSTTGNEYTELKNPSFKKEVVYVGLELHEKTFKSVLGEPKQTVVLIF